MACVDLTLKEMAAVVLTGEELWLKVQEGLQATLSKPTFETFIRPTGCSGFANGELRLLAPNPFAGVRLREQLLPSIAELASGVCGHPIQVVVLADFGHGGARGRRHRTAFRRFTDAVVPSETGGPRGPRRGVPSLNARHVFGRFVVGSNSRMAHAAALAVAEAPPAANSILCSSAVVSAWAKPT